jgi:hypothetical protein
MGSTDETPAIMAGRAATAQDGYISVTGRGKLQQGGAGVWWVAAVVRSIGGDRSARMLKKPSPEQKKP